MRPALPVLLALIICGPARAERTLTVSKPNAAKYERVDVLIHADLPANNPFDPQEISLDLVITTPAGKQTILPAFYSQDFERRRIAKVGMIADWIYPIGKPGWRARFAPSETGRYEVKCVVRTRGESQGRVLGEAAGLECVPSQCPGFLRVSAQDPRFLQFSEGQPFFAIGQNLAFIGPGQYMTLSKAEEAFGKLSANGANFLRVWTGCEDWAIGIEARKSAWGRSWAWKPPFAPTPDVPAGSDRKCVKLSGPSGTSLSVAPSHPLAVRPGTPYAFSGRMKGEGDVQLRIGLPGRRTEKGKSWRNARGWEDFRQEFTTAPDQYWLEPISLVLDGAGTVYLESISLREAAGGPELLWEAEVNRPILGYYNPIDCFLVDQVVEAAEKHGIYLQLCLFTRDLYMHRLRNDRSAEYEQATRQAKRLLRYAVARWGYSTHVAAWEYFNEIDPGLPTGRFYSELGQYLEEADPYRHLRTTSTWSPSPKDWLHPKLDIAQMHHYLRPASGPEWKDEVSVVLDKSRLLREKTPRGPVLMAEFGLADDKWGPSPFMRQDRQSVHLHNSLWASAMSGACGTAMFWWWEQIDQQDAYGQYRPLADFLSDLPLGAGEFQPITVGVSAGQVRAIALGGQGRACLWLFDPRATWWKQVVEKTALTETRGLTVEIPGLRPGRYRIRWWDTRRGGIAKEEAATHQRDGFRLSVPAFRGDIACKVDPSR